MGVFCCFLFTYPRNETFAMPLTRNLLCLDKIFTLISISGYGDVSCQTVLGKMFLVLFLLVGLVGAQSSNTFYTLVIAQKLGLRPYYTFIAG